MTLYLDTPSSALDRERRGVASAAWPIAKAAARRSLQRNVTLEQVGIQVGSDLDLAQRGLQGACPAFICSDGAGMYGNWLHIAPPDRLLPLNAADGLNLLRAAFERSLRAVGS